MGVLVNIIYLGRDCIEKLVILISVLHIYIVCDGLRCEGFYKGCCPGSSWNLTNQQCEACMPGFSGVNCSLQCPYPYYGVECQKTCNCNETICDVSTGCVIIAKDNEMTAAWSTLITGENSTGITMQNQTYINLLKTNTMHMSTEQMMESQSSKFNDILLMLIKIIGYVDVFMICTYFGLCIYDGKYRTRRVIDTTKTISRNATQYENIEIVFLSTTGNRLS